MGLTPDVAAGELIQSAWGNEIRDRTVQHFATAAERDGWIGPPDGAMAVTTDNNLLWQYNGTAWVAFPSGPHTRVTNTVPSGATSSTTNVTVPGMSVASFVKYRAETRLVIHISGALFIDDALAAANIAIDVNGTDYDIASARTGGATNENTPFSGTIDITGIPAGTIATIFAQIRVGVATTVATVDGRWSLTVTETM
jgi:hypothetical protein